MTRLRRLDAELASIPATVLDPSDERERERMHAWIRAQQRFFAETQQAAGTKGATPAGHGGLPPDEDHILRELERFADQAQACIEHGRRRTGT